MARTVVLALAVASAACSQSSTAPGDAGGDIGPDSRSAAEGGPLDAGSEEGGGRDSGPAPTFPCGIALGEAGFDEVQALDVDADGDAYFGGRLSRSGYVASMTAACELRWLKLFGSSDITDIAVTPGGDSVVLGSFGTNVEIGGRTLSPEDDSIDLYVARLDRGGSVQWVRQLGADHPGGIALAPEGDVLVSGRFRGTADFAGSELTAADSIDAFVARLAADGSLRWVRQLVGLDYAMVHDVAADADGNAYAVGKIGEGVDLGDVVLEPPGRTGGFIVSLDAAGNHRWSDAMGSAGAEGLRNVAIARGRIGTAGWHDDIVYLAQRRTDGTLLWSRSVAGQVDIGGVAIDGSDRLWVWMGADVVFEEEAVDSDGMVLAVLDGEGRLASTRTSRDAWGWPARSALAFNTDESRGYLGGRFDDDVAFGSVSVTGNNADGFVIGFEPSNVLSP